MDTKQVIIMRGLSGAGKSTWIRNNFESDQAFVCSADHLFTVDEEYRFDPKQLPEAHAACLRSFLRALDQDLPVIVVDNTNTTAVEIAPYYQTALAYGCQAKILTIICDPLVAFHRSVHGIPLKTIMQMYRRLLTEQLPPWWNEEMEEVDPTVL